MADPLDFLPYALAAHGGTVDGHEAQQLVAAGLTLLQRSSPLVRALAGRRAAILMPAGAPFLVALAAADGRGAVLIDPRAAAPEIADQLADADVGAVFTIAALATRVPETVVRVVLDDAPRTAQVIADGAVATVDLGSHFGLRLEGDRDAAGADEECAVVYTSAMRGFPLGARLSHRNLITNAHGTAIAAGQVQQDHVLALLPWTHLFGLTVTASAPLLSGARVSTMARFDPVEAVDLLSAGSITQVVAVPAVIKALLSDIDRRGGRLASALRLVICGGAVLEPEVQERWFAATGVELRQAYGLTEAAPLCLLNPVDRPNIRGAVGYPVPGVEVAILGAGDSTVPLAAGTEGEIGVRGANVFMGYVARGSDGLVRTSDGWLRTGDLGVQRRDGAIAFRDVIKPMFTRDGYNIYPRELERLISMMPGVQAVVLERVPDPARENDIAIIIEGTVTAADVRAWCQERLSACKQPSSITVR